MLKLAFSFVIWCAMASVAVAQSGPSAPVFDDTLQSRAQRSLDRLDLLNRGEALNECDLGLQETERQILRLHTELMLTSLACGETYGRLNLLPLYDNFIFRNEETLVQAQRRVQRDLENDGADFRAVDDLLTILANREAVELANRGTGTYCRMRQSQWDFSTQSTSDEFASYAEQLALRLGAGCRIR